MYIDPHVHCRDEEQSDKETIEHALHVAELSGIPGLDRWQNIAARLRQEGFSDKQIEDLTFNNAARIFGLEGIVTKSDTPGAKDLREYQSSPYY